MRPGRFGALLAALAVWLTLAAPALAVNPDEVLDDPALEERARDISANLRCLVCQNQSIDDSNADLARDLRIVVRERLVAGDSNEEVFDYVVSRYGQFVLLTPRLSTETLLLWAAPALLLLAGIVAIVVALRNRARLQAGPGLSPEEEAALRKILREREEHG